MKAVVDERASGASPNVRACGEGSILYLENDRSGGVKALLFYSTILALSLYALPREPLLVFVLWVASLSAGALFSAWLIVKQRRRVARIDGGIFTWNTFAIGAPPVSVPVGEILGYRVISGNDCPQEKGEILTPAGWTTIGTLYSSDHRRIATALQALNPAIRWEQVS